MWRRRCCTYTVRCYDQAGNTLWVQDYFRGATADSDPTFDLAVAAIGDFVFVAGPRIHSPAGAYWNCVKYDLASGTLISRHDLWPPVDRDGVNGPGDIQDICAGADGNLGVLWFNSANRQHMGSFAPVDLASQWLSNTANHTTIYPTFGRCELDAAGTLHVGGESSGFGPGRGRNGFVIDGAAEYVVGGGEPASGAPWYAATGFLAKVPNVALNNIPITYATYTATANWPANVTEAFKATTGYGYLWHSVSTRWSGTGSMLGGPGPGLDTITELIDVAMLRDSGGTGIGLVVIGSGQKRGATATADIFAPFSQPNGILATAGSLAESGCVGRFGLTGDFTKTYSPFGLSTSIGRVATVPGAGYVLAGSRSVDLPTLLQRDASDGHEWAHKHQSVTDLVVTPAGGCVTVGERSRQDVATETSFLTP